MVSALVPICLVTVTSQPYIQVKGQPRKASKPYDSRVMVMIVQWDRTMTMIRILIINDNDGNDDSNINIYNSTINDQ